MLSEVFFLILLVSPLSNCLGRCVTTHENKRLECTNLQDFPRGADYTKVLQITNSSLVTLASGILHQQQFVLLKAAVLQDDNIRSIAERAFNKLSSLLLLDMTRNELEELHKSTFQGADFLKVLILAENRVQYLHERAFAGLNNLIYLDLSRNNISYFPGGFLKHLPSIKYVDISFNPLKTFQPGQFLESTSLAVLRVSFRELQISQELFADLPNLQVLDLSGSDLKILPAQILYPLSKLRVLYFDTPLLANEDTFVPSTVEKFVQWQMDVGSRALVDRVLENIDDFSVMSKDIDFLQYLEDYIDENDNKPENNNKTAFNSLPEWKLRIIQKCLLFAMLVYLSFMYTMCLSQIVKSFIQKPYQRIYVDDI